MLQGTMQASTSRSPRGRQVPWSWKPRSEEKPGDRKEQRSLRELPGFGTSVLQLSQNEDHLLVEEGWPLKDPESKNSESTEVSHF